MSIADCEVALRKTAVELRPLLEPWGFEFHFEQAAQGHQAFASGFFVRGELKIGLIYREQDKLGAVTYENAATNVSHDHLMASLGLIADQRLRYDERTLTSLAADGGSAVDALRADLSTLSFILRDHGMLSQSISEARRKGDQASEEAAARNAAKRDAWLRRRRGLSE